MYAPTYLAACIGRLTGVLGSELITWCTGLSWIQEDLTGYGFGEWLLLWIPGRSTRLWVCRVIAMHRTTLNRIRSSRLWVWRVIAMHRTTLNRRRSNRLWARRVIAMHWTTLNPRRLNIIRRSLYRLKGQLQTPKVSLKLCETYHSDSIYNSPVLHRYICTDVACCMLMHWETDMNS
jgi:hypothetical protein